MTYQENYQGEKEEMEANGYCLFATAECSCEDCETYCGSVEGIWAKKVGPDWTWTIIDPSGKHSQEGMALHSLVDVKFFLRNRYRGTHVLKFMK